MIEHVIHVVAAFLLGVGFGGAVFGARRYLAGYRDGLGFAENVEALTAKARELGRTEARSEGPRT